MSYLSEPKYPNLDKRAFRFHKANILIRKVFKIRYTISLIATLYYSALGPGANWACAVFNCRPGYIVKGRHVTDTGRGILADPNRMLGRERTVKF